MRILKVEEGKGFTRTVLGSELAGPKAYGERSVIRDESLVYILFSSSGVKYK
jgi:hypothetical protein